MHAIAKLHYIINLSFIDFAFPSFIFLLYVLVHELLVPCLYQPCANGLPFNLIRMMIMLYINFIGLFDTFYLLCKS